MVDITLNKEAGRTYSLDLKENSINYEVQLDAQRGNFMMSDSCYGYYYAGPQHFTQRIDNACCCVFGRRRVDAGLAVC